MKSSFIGALALVLLAVTAPALAQDARDQARQNFGAGVEAFEAGQYESALTSFQEAYRLAPHPSVRVNMANCYEHLRRPLEAMFHYEHFLTESPDAPPAQRAEVEEALRSLRGQVGEVTVRVVPDGALVRIDEAEVRRTPILHTIRMVPGSHLLEVRAEGYQSVRREFVVEGGQPADISIRLERGEDTVAEPLPVVTAVAPAEEGGAVAAEPDT
ncbi:MAG: PEGA domain-containing protein, partial [Deltaproteobacteria bacterium]|nr:PEGA domain-containing protein [Deltaproteobacteria bacterium]